MHSDSDNLIGCFTAFFDHGLLLIEDADTSAAHEGWDAATQPVHFDVDSLYLAVSPAVDGPVTVCAYRQEAPEETVADLTLCFDDEFESKFGVIKLRDSDDVISLTAHEQRGIRRLRVFVDEPGWTSRAVVVIS